MKRLACFLMLSCLATVCRADFMINVSYSGDPAFQSSFTNAVSTWESLLSGYQDGLVNITTPGSSAMPGSNLTLLNISASIVAIDGLGGTLGQAGPTAFAVDTSGFALATDAIMEFDSDDISNLTSAELNSVILHEMAHAMGFGTLWDVNSVYVDGSGEYLGTNAAAAWQSEFGQLGTPDVELEGKPGTVDGHWNEVLRGAGLTGITDTMGRDMRNELMTGWLNSDTFISDMTVASFVDIGFTRAVAVPEPSSLAMAGFTAVGGCLGLIRRKRART